MFSACRTSKASYGTERLALILKGDPHKLNIGLRGQSIKPEWAIKLGGMAKV
jgi:hypothetical protein